ncbi:YbaK/EbsC family protein [Arhodomonas sp. AD133]|uniref:YbaK/EbsC family protein n=1 Tax=Arhodomonas sp. AD133 TaxID=3415009 RepID=UPI003EBD4193
MAKGPERVRRALVERGIDVAIRRVDESTRTAAEAAEALGVYVGQIAKSLVFRGEASGDALLVIASGDRRVSESLLADLAGEPIGRADAAFVREHTGFAIGGVAPLGHPEPLRCWIDEDLTRFDTVWAAAGSPFAVFPVAPSALPAMTGGELARLAGGESA